MEQRRRYPVDERGVPLSPEGIGECYEVCLRGVKETNRHHLSWPRAEHRGLSKEYRDAKSMIVGACVCKHADLHATYMPPEKPDADVMQGIANGSIIPTETEVFIQSRIDANVASGML